MIKLKNLERSYPLGKEKFFTSCARSISISRKATLSRSWGRPAPANPRCCTFSECTITGGQGEYFLGEAAVHHLKPKERATLRNEQIGFVFQQYHLLDDLTVYENLDIPLSYRRYSKSERAALVADTLDRFQIVGKKIYIRVSFPADNNSSSVLRARSSLSRSFCSLTSPRETCTPVRAKKSWSCFASSMTKA